MHRHLGWLLAATVVVTGCSTPASQENQSSPTPDMAVTSTTPSTDPSTAPEAPQAIWQQAVETTEQATALLVDVQLITNVEGFERITAGSGYVEPSLGHGDIDWTDDLGASREVITSSGHFLEIDGTWFALEEGSELPTTIAFDPLEALADATNVVELGTEDVNGSPTIRLEADLDSADALATMGFSQEERSVFDSAAEATFTGTIWIDDTGGIVRVVREFNTSSIDGDPISATSLFLLEEAGAARPIDVPETADAVPAPV